MKNFFFLIKKVEKLTKMAKKRSKTIIQNRYFLVQVWFFPVTGLFGSSQTKSPKIPGLIQLLFCSGSDSLISGRMVKIQGALDWPGAGVRFCSAHTRSHLMNVKKASHAQNKISLQPCSSYGLLQCYAGCVPIESTLYFNHCGRRYEIKLSKDTLSKTTS